MPASHAPVRGLVAAAALILAALPGSPAAQPAPAVQAAFEQLNRIRERAGLQVLSWSGPLAEAARGHAQYLSRQEPDPRGPAGRSLHSQSAGAEGFTGADPAERALRAGYPHRRVRENVSQGTDDPETAVGGLMTAIYHRLAFLDREADEAGIGRRGKVFVFLLGRSDYRALCRGGIPEAVFEPPALCVDTAVDPELMARLCRRLPPGARYEPAYRYACLDGQRLDADYMEDWCADPPAAAVLEGSGGYYEPCGGDLRIAAEWWRDFCETPPPAARYRHSGSYYEICEGTRVHADWLETYCRELPPEALYPYDGRYLEVCDGAVRMHAQWRERLDARRHAGQPTYVLWPPQGAQDAAPAFYEEQPDPLPDREVSGNPLSLQVVPEQAGSLSLESARMYRLGEDGRRTPVELRILDAESDPHGKLRPGEHALFPLEHLGWGREYAAELELRQEHGSEALEWRFATRAPDAPVLTAGEGTRRLRFPADGAFVLFMPPTDSTPRPLQRYSYQAPARARVQVEPIDYNTVRLQISSHGCRPVRISPVGRPPVELTARGCPD